VSGLLIAGSHGVPSTAPLESFVATDYERFDGMDLPQELGYIPVGLGDGFTSPAPGKANVGQRLLEPGIPGKVGSVGATPLPVADAIHKPESQMATAAVGSQPTTQYNLGPGGAAPGLDQSLFLQFVNENPPQPDSLASIFA
jgi:hypothetical protein